MKTVNKNLKRIIAAATALAAACGARLILACLDRGLYPSWDAIDLRSVSLAEKLGYHRAEPYPIYRLGEKQGLLRVV